MQIKIDNEMVFTLCDINIAASQSSQWYAWGPVHMQCRLCVHCWTYWKKYGGLKMPTRLGRLMGEDGTMGDGN